MEVYAGIDWSREFHALCVIDAKGSILFEDSFDHKRPDLERLIAKLKDLQGAGSCRVGIELNRGSVVEMLNREGLVVVPIHPSHVVHARGCFGAAGNKNDRKDAQILAEVVRTSGARLRELSLDTEETRSLKRLDDCRQDLLKDKQRAVQRLEARLQEVFPGAIGLFSELDNLISLAFLEAYPTAKAAEQITVAKLKTFLGRRKYSGGQAPEKLLAKLQAGAPPIAVTEGDAIVIKLDVRCVRDLGEKLDEIEKHIETALAKHPLHTVYESLPGARTVTVASLVANLGDLSAVQRPEDLQAAAGLVPVVQQSGKYSRTSIRRACNKNLRRALTMFAEVSRRADDWAASIYDAARDRGKKHPHALRILARAWVLVIFRMVRDRATYDPKRHKRLAA